MKVSFCELLSEGKLTYVLNFAKYHILKVLLNLKFVLTFQILMRRISYERIAMVLYMYLLVYLLSKSPGT